MPLIGYQDMKGEMQRLRSEMKKRTYTILSAWYDGSTFREIGPRHGLTRQRIQQIVKATLDQYPGLAPSILAHREHHLDQMRFLQSIDKSSPDIRKRSVRIYVRDDIRGYGLLLDRRHVLIPALGRASRQSDSHLQIQDYAGERVSVKTGEVIRQSHGCLIGTTASPISMGIPNLKLARAEPDVGQMVGLVLGKAITPRRIQGYCRVKGLGKVSQFGNLARHFIGSIVVNGDGECCGLIAERPDTKRLFLIPIRAITSALIDCLSENP